MEQSSNGFVAKSARVSCVPCHEMFVRADRITIARGRDAADVPMIQTFGAHILKTFTVVSEEAPDPALDTAA